MTAVMTGPSVPAGTDRTQERAPDQRVSPGKARKLTRTLKVLPVNIEVDDSGREFLVFVSPRLEAQALGISYHRARLRKCACIWPGHLERAKCSTCGGWHQHGVSAYLIKLMRTYPKISVRVPA